jgi:tetratricopeptide (TPR) repeat protein
MRNVCILVLTTMLTAAGCRKAETPGASKTPSGGTADPASRHAGPPHTLAEWAHGATLLDGLGRFHWTITTSSGDAQRYFDQGMRLLWAFNHDESTRSFARAAEIDPACAMCYWGVALTVGPNYNLPMMAEPRAMVAWNTLQQAQAHSPRSTPVEQALIGALGQRYRGPQPLDPSNEGPVLTAYATAMRAVAKQFPDDLDVQVLFAEAMMDTNAWKLWSIDGTPAPGTAEIVTTLERVLAREPMHPGANHYYVHAIEASSHPEQALASAERLVGMMPGAGHLQHMPAHIMQRIGRYEEAAQANRDGITSDLAYMDTTPPLDYYGMYLAHNYQFLNYSAVMEGRKAEAFEATRKMRGALPVEMLLAMPGMDWSLSQTYETMIRFGDWDDIVAERVPDTRLRGLTGGYLYARSVALAEKGRVADARAALAQLQKLAADTSPDDAAGFNSATDVFAVAIQVAQAHIALARGRADDAVTHLRDAAAKEDRLAYDEPADWIVPVRHQLGATLLKAGRAADAEAVYREDLARHPDNGWALFGLGQALSAQNKRADAARVEAQFKEAWKHADVTLTSSVF